jgi:hypothetical protein
MVYFLTFLVPDGESLIWRNVAWVYIPLQQRKWLFLKVTDGKTRGNYGKR